MIRTRSLRRAIATALGGMILAAVLPATRGQLTQPRRTSLARTGMRAGETVEVTLRVTDLEGVNRADECRADECHIVPACVHDPFPVGSL
jgi:hypothetical protein